MDSIKVATDFYHKLTNRNKKQGDGLHTAEEFRKKYLARCDNKPFWDGTEKVVFDFTDVVKIGPSFANEAFAYFMKITNKNKFNAHIKFENISKVQQLIIQQELDSGYSK